MKKTILLMLLTVLASVGLTSKASVTITVDHAQNITMAGSNGYGSVVALNDGTNTFEASELIDQPYVCQGANGAEIESLTIDGAPQSPAYGMENGYRFGISDGMNINIVTKAASTDVTVSFSIDKVNTVKVSYGDEALYNPSQVTVAKGTEMKIEPMPGYSLHLSCMNGYVADNGDGTYRFIANADETIWSTSTITGMKVELNLDFASNVDVSFGMGDEQYSLVMLANGTNIIATDNAHLPLNIAGAAEATVKSVTVDGSVVNSSPDGVWHIGVADGNVVNVVSQGRAKDVTFENFGTVGFEGYNITIAGEKVEASGMDPVKATGHVGDAIVVAPLIGTSIDYVSPGKVQADGTWLATVSESTSAIYISGKKETAVTISVDDASRVIVKELDGYGDILTLENGANKFKLEDLALPLNINATEGNRIVSVMMDGEAVTAGGNGSYKVNPVEGSNITIISEVKPQAVNITFSLGENWDKLSATVDGEPLEITSGTFSHQFIPGAVLSLTPAKGYEIVSVLAPGNDASGDKHGYDIVVSATGTVSVVCEKMTAREGYAIVTIDSNISLWYDEYNDAGEYQRRLGTDEAYEVKIGSKVEIYTFTEAIWFSSVTVNGTPVEANADNRRKYTVSIDGDSEIIVEAYKKLLVSTERVTNPDNHMTIGNLYIKDGDNKVTSYYALPGETVEFISEPAKGYKLDYIKCVYPEGRDEELTDSYTVTQADLDNYELMVFRGSYSMEDDTKTLYYIEGNSTYAEIDGNFVLMGEVWPLNEEGKSTIVVTAYENDAVDFEVKVEPGYSFKNLSLFYDSEKVLDKPYVVNPIDADDKNLISIVGIFSIGSGSVSLTDAEDSGLAYNKAAMELVSGQPITLYNLSGVVVGYSADGKISLGGYTGGVYVAVSGNRIIKFTL